MRTNQPLGFDPDFMKLLSRGRDEPSDQGQFGLTLQTFLPILNAPDFKEGGDPREFNPNALLYYVR